MHYRRAAIICVFTWAIFGDFLKAVRADLYDHEKALTLRSALEIASLYVLKKWEGTEDLDEDEKTLKRT